MINKAKEITVTHREPILYVLFGGGATLINIFAYELFATYMGINFMVANVMAWVLAFVFAFICNKIWVFESRSWERNVAVKEFTGFFGSRLGTGILDSVMMFLLVGVMSMAGFPAKVIVNIIVTILNYIASKFFIFKQRPPK
jgi:Predicted membrane protein